ncbi:EAL domain-containing protein [Caldimonas tepidiphila]|uniref:sensor domain-containing phosphodiesterase n=1 Tax=Caldimonas tepidiphila TaxID=2315841 RepID=UPI000E5B430C|nr:EAL domain-containing protein [Caldimonas tepidiphila]
MTAQEYGLPSFFQQRVDPESENAEDVVPQLLRALRRHLGLQVAFVSRFSHDRRVIEYVDASPGAAAMITPGDSHVREETYCQRIVDGRLPELIPDARAEPEADRLAVTDSLSIGSYLGVPIRFSDGTVYGTFCGIGEKPDESLNQRDVELMRVFADIAARLLEHEAQQSREAEEIRLRTRGVLEAGGMSMVFQPILRLNTSRTVGLEALARFRSEQPAGPDIWFNQAARVGLGAELEMRAVEMALDALGQLPSEVYVSCNVSPEVAVSEPLLQLLCGVRPERVVLEITEHAYVSDYERLARALAPLRQRGMRLAVDDAGAGYASFRHILALQPDLIKLDMSLTQGIDTHPGRRALAAALIRFAQETGSQIVAEGVETAGELEVLRALQAHVVQGYLIGRPLRLADACERLQAETRL